jgi:hypothetical protein
VVVRAEFAHDEFAHDNIVVYPVSGRVTSRDW